MFTPKLLSRSLRGLAAATALATTGLATTPAPVFSASKTTKASKATKTTKPSASKATATGATPVGSPVKTTLPAPRTPKNDLVGWEMMAETEWPKARDAVRAEAINGAIRVHQSPDDFSPALSMQKGKSAYGAIAFLALGRKGDFVRVLLPLRPNGTVGWVKASEVRLDRTHYRIIIEVDRNLLTVESNDGVIVSTKVALGTNNTPTPTGLFYVREIVPQANPNGGLGPVALGLSGLSEELRTFAGGFGRVAIHGTNAPGKLGGDVSHGCVRMDNPTIVKLSKLLPLGTPVEILRTRTEQKTETERIASAWIDQTIVAPENRSDLPTLSTADATIPAAVAAAATVAPTSSTLPAATTASSPPSSTPPSSTVTP